MHQYRLPTFHAARWLPLFCLLASVPQAQTSTIIANAPFQTENAPPNIMLLMDKSGSMRERSLPEYVADSRVCVNNANTWSASSCTHSDILTRGGWGDRFSSGGTASRNNDTGYYASGGSRSGSFAPPMAAAGYNQQSYNPLVTYTPPKYPDGTDYPQMNRTNTNEWRRVYGLRDYSGYWATVALYYRWENLRDSTFRYTGTNILKGHVGDSVYNQLMTKYPDGKLPIHYFTVGVRWCNTAKTTGSRFKNAVFGDGKATHCQVNRDVPAGYSLPYFYRYLGQYDGTDDNDAYAPFEMVVLDVNNPQPYTHRYYDSESGAVKTFTRTFDDEMTNYANWFAYYRSRAASTKTILSHVLYNLPSEDTADQTATEARIGFMSFGNRFFVPVKKFDNTQKQAMQNAVRMIYFESATPTRDSLADAGHYFAKGIGGSGSPTYYYPKEEEQTSSGTSTGERVKSEAAAINLSCQRNHIMLFSDGEWNGGAGDDLSRRSINGSLDRLRPAGLPEKASVYGVEFPKGPATQGTSLWPRPINTASRNGSQMLADVALYYWMTDLRPEMQNDVPENPDDPATWQHINLHTIGVGVEGKLPTYAPRSVESKIKAGSLDWESSGTDEKIDDLWHAAINGFGRYESTRSPEEMRLSIQSLLEEAIFAQSGIGQPTLSAIDVTDGNQKMYLPWYKAGWVGDLVAYKVNEDGSKGDKLWHASDRIGAMLDHDINDASDKPWMTKRKVFTNTGNTGTPFQAGNLNALQLNALAGSVSRQQEVIEYLRGGDQNEGTNEGQMRQRNGRLGDIVNAGATLVALPNAPYDENIDTGYEAFKTANKDRKPVVYVPANDGMVHATDGDTGDELWAYIPANIIRPAEQGGIASLSYRANDRIRPFKHYYYADATPYSIDAKVGNTWKSVLIGGLGKGGTSYYALDVTDGASNTTTETVAAKKLMWEFTDQNMGYTYGRPLIVKTRAWGGKWVAILPSGLNNGSNSKGIDDPDYQPGNGDGKGRIFIVDLATGQKLKEIGTEAGTAAQPSGLAYISGFVESYNNQEVSMIYGGDQLGNFWRFDLTDSNPANWSVAKMAELRDANGHAQPVTTEPVIEVTKQGNAVSKKRWIFVGTGRMLHRTDLKDNTYKNSMYAFIDGTQSNGISTPLPASSLPLKRADMTRLNSSTTKPDLTTSVGWYQDFDAGYSITTTPQAIADSIIYSAARHKGAAADCTPAYTSLVSARNYDTGNTMWEDGSAMLSIDGLVSGLFSLYGKDSSGNGRVMVGLQTERDYQLATLNPFGSSGSKGMIRRYDIRSITP